MTKKAGAAGSPLAEKWSVPLSADIIPEEGLHREIEAPAEACAAVAELAEVRDISALSATFDLIRAGALVQVTGRVRALVGQTCVVTLEPMETDVDEPIEITFTLAQPEKSAQSGATEPRRRNAESDLPEPLIGGTLDLGAIATEFVILGIDPYPRKAGVEFAPPAAENDDPHPFAALAALKDRSGGGKS